MPTQSPLEQRRLENRRVCLLFCSRLHGNDKYLEPAKGSMVVVMEELGGSCEFAAL